MKTLKCDSTFVSLTHTIFLMLLFYGNNHIPLAKIYRVLTITVLWETPNVIPSPALGEPSCPFILHRCHDDRQEWSCCPFTLYKIPLRLWFFYSSEIWLQKTTTTTTILNLLFLPTDFSFLLSLIISPHTSFLQHFWLSIMFLELEIFTQYISQNSK